MVIKKKYPTEDEEHILLAQWLDLANVLFFHTPNEGLRHVSYAVKLQKMGVKAGVPDFMVLDKPLGHHYYSGIAIELKRQRGAKSKVSPEQERWISDLRDRGWKAEICYGADEAITLLESLGFKPGKRLDITDL